MLTCLEALPEGLADVDASQLHRFLSGPTLIHLRGRRSPPLFVSVLLHGNEDTGWDAVRALLGEYRERGVALPRDLSLFIGNVAAARKGCRRLDGQPDYNRVWKGGGTPEHEAMRAVVDQMRIRGVFASIDIHNNTGRNPHYACINSLDHRFLFLASLFSRTIVFFLHPDTVQSMAFSALCPAVTVECGKPGDAWARRHVQEFVNAALHLKEVPCHRLPAQDYDLFQTVARVTVPPGVTFSFDNEPADLHFQADLDELNFRELPPQTVLAMARRQGKPLAAVDGKGQDVSARYFHWVDGEVRTRTPLMPSMLTCDARIVRQDCLCYLMERLPPLE